ncbi:hypothetical protein COO60DRAFT_1643783 [Scenedesmus sp. NREL 46B-D3]|nr:hypothetical protein COO60DRAFT_1643783 [Scenedesmus sp. NREL 46B-D3]
MVLLAAAAACVRAVHIALMAWVVLVPWVGSCDAALLHALMMPFLFLHWALNDDACCLTWLECTLRGVPVSSSFVHSLVSPVYKFPSEHAASSAVWAAAVGLWLVGLYRLTTVHAATLRQLASHLLRAWRQAMAPPRPHGIGDDDPA